MLQLLVIDLAFAHVGRHVAVDHPGGHHVGTLFDVVHTPGRASWLTFRVGGHLTVVVVEDPADTVVLVEEAGQDPASTTGRVVPAPRFPVAARLRRLARGGG